jgi:hypothetical protein
MKPAHGELDFLGREQRTRASALVAQRDRLDLPRTIAYDAEEPGHGIRLVLEFELLMPGLLIDSHAFEARVEDVESDRASGPQVAADALEAGELIADVFEVLEGAERGEYQREWFTGKLEVRSNAPSRRRSRGRGLPVPTRRSYPWCLEIPEGDRACKGTARNSCASLSDAVIYTAWCLGDNEGLES